MSPKLPSLFRFFLIACLIPAFTAVVPASGAEEEDEEEFTPRSDAPPAKRTGGASRGGSSAATAATVSILAPAETVGLTTREQPAIYWNLSADTKHPIDIAINDPNQLEDPVFETTLKGPHKAGLHKLDLGNAKGADKPLKLKPGVKYDVVVEVVANQTGASENPNATCRIMRLPPDKAPAAAGDEKDPARRAAIYAKEGIWFDYIDALNAAIEADPKDENLLARRAGALAAQGLQIEADGTIREGPEGAGQK